MALKINTLDGSLGWKVFGVTLIVVFIVALTVAYILLMGKRLLARGHNAPRKLNRAGGMGDG